MLTLGRYMLHCCVCCSLSRVPIAFPTCKAVQVRVPLMNPLLLTQLFCVDVLVCVIKNTEKRRPTEAPPCPHFIAQQFTILLYPGGYKPNSGMQKHMHMQFRTLNNLAPGWLAGRLVCIDMGRCGLFAWGCVERHGFICGDIGWSALTLGDSMGWHV